MEKTQNLVDNWQLELTAALLSDDYKLADYANLAYDPSSYMQSIATRKFQREMLASLFQLLDLIIISDVILYEHEHSSFWQRHIDNTLEPVLPLLKKVRLSRETKLRLSEQINKVVSPNVPKVIEESSRIYLGVANLLGVNYWPSPQRASFIQEHFFSRVGNSFVNCLKTQIDQELKEIVDEVYSSLGAETRNIVFPGFGSSILLECESKSHILSTAIEYRRTKSCKAFRDWAKVMDKALKDGNVTQIVIGIRDFEGVINDIKSDLGMLSREERKVELEIGLSPSISFDVRLLESIIKPLNYRKYHLVFIRSHLARVLKNEKIYRKAYQLFPEIEEVF